jgi:hypothetical protein
MGGTAIVKKTRNRRPLLLLGAGGFLLVVLVIVMKVVYPRVAAGKIRSKLIAKIEQRLGVTPRIGDISVSFGHATIHNVDIGAVTTDGQPLVKISQIDIEFGGGQSLLGRVNLGAMKVTGVAVRAQRRADGTDNFSALLAKARAPNPSGETDGAQGGGIKPTMISIVQISATMDDAKSGIRGSMADGDAQWSPTDIRGMLRDLKVTVPTSRFSNPLTVCIDCVASEQPEPVQITTTIAAQQIAIQKMPEHQPSVQVAGGSLALWPKLSLSGIAGNISADDKQRGRFAIDLSGGYGGVATQLWTARGWIDPLQAAGILDIRADKFNLDRLAPILANAQLIDYQKTTIDANLHVEMQRDGGTFGGTFHLADLAVGHPMLADREVHGLNLEGKIAGKISRSARMLEITQGEFLSRGLPVQLTGSIALAGGQMPDGNLRPAKVAKGHFVVPPISCQAGLNAIPKEMAPYLAGYQLSGTFSSDIEVAIDWNDLDATVLDGSLAIRKCKAKERPSDSPERLKEDFEHYVEVDKGEWLSFEVGPENPDFVPLVDISPFVAKSIITTEDSAFATHHGFIPSEFRTALVNNLKAGAFKYGASSITMQFVKNVLLYRKKTLARKLQELFLTWDVENVLDKDRIMEIYLNVIEYGPGLYGIGPAAAHYFDKAAKDLTPTEAAFFSSILPAPKQRYKQYCAGTLTKWTEDKIARILGLMLKRGRLTKEEYDLAIVTPLVFAKDGSETEAECLTRQKQSVKNARPTNPNEK